MASKFTLDDHVAPQVRAPEQRPAQIRKRPLFGVRMSKLGVEYTLPGQHLCWISDYDDGRLQYALECGYTFVRQDEVGISNAGAQVSPNEDSANRISRHGGLSESNRPMRTYLMKIPNEIYEETQAAIQVEADRYNDQLYADPDGANQYRPTSIATKIGSKLV